MPPYSMYSKPLSQTQPLVWERSRSRGAICMHSTLVPAQNHCRQQSRQSDRIDVQCGMRQPTGCSPPNAAVFNRAFDKWLKLQDFAIAKTHTCLCIPLSANGDLDAPYLARCHRYSFCIFQPAAARSTCRRTNLRHPPTPVGCNL